MKSGNNSPSKSLGAFHSTKISKISGLKLNGTVKIPVKVFENLGIRFECTLFNGISGIIENFVFHSQEISVLVSRPSVGSHGHSQKMAAVAAYQCSACGFVVNDKSVSAASMQQFTSLNQQRYVTAVVMFFFQF